MCCVCVDCIASDFSVVNLLCGPPDLLSNWTHALLTRRQISQNGNMSTNLYVLPRPIKLISLSFFF
jgi:hypothetical protein